MKYVILALVLMSGCATTAKVVPIVKSCEPSPAQVDQIFMAATNIDTAAGVAAIDALEFALCVADKAATEIIDTLSSPPDASALTKTAAEYSPVVDVLKAWKASHGLK